LTQTLPHTLPENTIPALLFRGLERFPDREAFIIDDDRETYRELFDRSVEVARGLVGIGIRPGDRVGILMHNSLDLIHVLFGSAMARAIAVPVNARLSSREIAHIVQDSAMRALFTGDRAAEHVDLVGRVRGALPGLDAVPADVAGRSAAAPSLEKVFLLGTTTAPGFLSRASLLGFAAAVSTDDVLEGARQTDPEDTYLMMYTSGTTANPKGCLLPHRAIVTTGYKLGRDRLRFTAEDKLWNALPFFHVSAQAPMTGVLDAGATYISMLHFTPAEAVAVIVAEGATVLYPAYPALTQPILNNAGDIRETFSQVRVVLTTGPAKLLLKYQEQLPEWTTHISCYGSTELGGVAIMGRLNDSTELRSSAGVPLDGIEMEIRDLDTGAVVDPDVAGAIWVRGFNLFTEYHNDPVKTAAAFDADGWFNTEDIGSVDASGYLTFGGRYKDMLKVGGENVASVEIESYLTSHPAVAIAAVIGRPDEKYDEVPVAFVELIPGQTVDAEELIEFARRGLAAFKVPREVRFMAEADWPMSSTKIQKFKLRELLSA
jgi:fatty-acyl-CoA synthase